MKKRTMFLGLLIILLAITVSGVFAADDPPPFTPEPEIFFVPDENELDVFDRTNWLEFLESSIYAPKIVGGATVDPVNKYPFMASLQLHKPDGAISYYCGGSLITTEWVLTAAHCWYDSITGEPLEIVSGDKVVLGEFSHSVDSGNEQIISIDAVFIHEQYDAVALTSDIALLHLSSPATLNAYVDIISMVDYDTTSLGETEEPQTVAGWGTLSYKGSTPDQLQSVDITYLEDSACSIYGSGFDTDSMLCAGIPLGGKDACQGDSGGPLFYKPGSEYIQTGIVSWGNGCALANYPGVYSSLDTLSTWATDVSENSKSFLRTPGDGDGIQDYPDEPLILTWFAFPGVDGYKIDIATDSNFTDIVSQGAAIADTSYTPSGTFSSGTYYWRVASGQNDGSWSYNLWSETRSFEINIEAVPPGAFDKLGPVSGVVDQGNSVILSWDASSGAEEYWFCLDGEPKDDCIYYNSTTDTSIRYLNLTYGKTYYWQIKAMNPFYSTFADGAETASWSFTVMDEPAIDGYEPDDSPGTATLILDGVSQTHNLVTENDVDWYKFQLSYPSAVTLETSGLYTNDTEMWLYDSGLSEVEYDNNGGTGYNSYISRTCGATELSAGTYYVKVGSYFEYGLPNYDILFDVTEDCRPDPPTLTSPTNGSTTTDPTPQMTWSAVDNAELYRIQIADSAGFINIIQSKSIYGGESTIFSTLSDGKYYWRVKAGVVIGGKAVYNGWSDIWSVTIAALDTPTLTSPTNGSTTIDTTPQMTWSAVDNAELYRIQIADSAGFINIIQSKSVYGGESTIFSTLSDGKYYWRVKAGVVIGGKAVYNGWSDVWSVTITSLDTPTLTSPTNGSTIIDTTPQMSWIAVDNAELYRIQIADSAGFINIIQSKSVYGGESTIFSTLSDGKYYWRVKAGVVIGGKAVYNGWSDIWSVTITSLDTPTLTSPTNGSTTIDTTPQMSWIAVDNAELYRIHIAIDEEFTNIVQAKSVYGKENTVLSTLAEGTYYWRVKAGVVVGGKAIYNGWSSAFLFELTSP